MRKEDDTWVACDPQEISSLAARLRARRGRRHFVRAALGALGATGAAAAVAVAVLFMPPRDEGPDFAGISCHRVAELAEAYRRKQLPPELQDQVRRHIALCPACRTVLNEVPAVSRRLRVAPGELAQHTVAP